MNDEIIVEILSDDEPKAASGTFTDDEGREVKWATRKQEARLEAGGYAYPFEVRLDKEQPKFAKGRYRMLPAKMLTVNKGNANWSKYPVLVPVAGAK